MSDLEKSVFKRPRGRPPVEAPRKLVSLRLDVGVIEALEASGPGWRQRTNDILKAALKGEKPPENEKRRAYIRPGAGHLRFGGKSR